MTDHRDMMISLCRDNKWEKGAEIGLGSGFLFERFLAEGLCMVGVDIGENRTRKERVNRIVSSHENSTVHWTTSEKASKLVDNRSLDFVFIDAGHSYKAAKLDISCWLPKVKTDGWIGGHDYHPKFPGVIRAVDEAFGSGFEVLPGFIWVRS